MNIFNKGVSSENKFIYQVGSVVTEKPWKQPDYNNVQMLVEKIKTINNGKYDIFLVGGVVNGRVGKTWDIDFVVTGEIIANEFENFLHDCYETALNEYNLLIDIRWYDKPIWYLNYLLNKNKKCNIKTIRFGYCKKTIDNSHNEIDLFKSGKKISEYLVERKIEYPTKKCLEQKNTFCNYFKI